MTQTIASLGRMRIGSCFLMDPSLMPPKEPKPQDEDYTDAKILSFYPPTTDIHEKRKQVGISEGIVSFFLPFSKNESPIEVIATTKFTHVMKQVEPSLWLNLVIQHPDGLYSSSNKGEGLSFQDDDDSQKGGEDDDEGETIANTKFNYSQFTEDDSQIFYYLLEQLYNYYVLSHGTFGHNVALHTKSGTLTTVFQEQFADFTRSFAKYFFSEEYTSNFFWNVCFQGFFYCPIDKKSFLQAEFVQNGLLLDFEDTMAHACIFHENYFISSSLPHLQVQDLYSYLVGTVAVGASSLRNIENGNVPVGQVGALFKCLQYKGAGKLEKISDQNQEETKNNEVETAESTSNFCRVNPNVANSDLTQGQTQMLSQFIIGPQLGAGQPSTGGQNQPGGDSIEVFAPIVWLKNEQGVLEPFKLFVFLGFKTMLVCLFKPDAIITCQQIRQLHAYANRQVVVLSQLLDQQISKPLPAQDTEPVRFFYFSKMNMALKISNLVSKDVFSLELKHILNQMHQQFKQDPENCLEQCQNTAYYWVVGVNSLGREIYLVFPPNYTSIKVEQEKQKIMKNYFVNLFT